SLSNEALLDMVVAGMPDAAIVIGREGRVVAFNAAARMIAPALARGAPASLALRVPEIVEAVREVAGGSGSRSVEYYQRVPVDRWFKVHVEPLGSARPIARMPVVRQVVDGLQTLAADRGVEIAVTQPAVPALAPGDRDELTRVFENLIENALKYGAPGKRVEIGFSAASASDGSPEVLIAVRDYGPGIATEHLPRLTERFYRVDVTQSRAEGGTGLGLSLVKHILNRHRGKLIIESEAGNGATFTVRLPLVPSESAAVP